MITLPPHAQCTYGDINNAQLILIRGLPGSGKSTLAKQFAALGYTHLEADMYFIQEDGTYRYDARRIKDAHNWCINQMYMALAAGRRVVVSNAFTTRKEINSYVDLVPPHIAIIVCRGQWENVHGVPADVLQRMADRWED